MGLWYYKETIVSAALVLGISNKQGGKQSRILLDAKISS